MMIGLRGRVSGMLGVRGASHTSQLLRSTILANVHRLQDHIEGDEDLLFKA